MDVEVMGETMTRTQFQPFVDLARHACAKWDVIVPVVEGSVADQALAVRDALNEAADVAAGSEVAFTYPGDTPGLVGTLPGVSLEGLERDIVEGGNPGEEWGICARVTAGDLVFDVVIVFGIDQDTAESMIRELDGREEEFVCIEDIAEMAECDTVEVRLHADSWRYMKEFSRDLALDLVTTLSFRRPGAWDLFRGEMTGLVPMTLPAWSEDAFQSRYLLSLRYDMDNMAESRAMLGLYARWSPDPFTSEWQLWFPQITDLLHAIGTPRAIVGMSVIVNLAVEEENGYDWEAVNVRTVAIACGLTPVQAHALLEHVRMDTVPFLDLPQSDEKRFRLLGSTVVPDAMLSTIRASSSGRSDAYDRLVSAMEARDRAETEDTVDA